MSSSPVTAEVVNNVLTAVVTAFGTTLTTFMAMRNKSKKRVDDQIESHLATVLIEYKGLVTELKKEVEAVKNDLKFQKENNDFLRNTIIEQVGTIAVLRHTTELQGAEIVQLRKELAETPRRCDDCPFNNNRPRN